MKYKKNAFKPNVVGEGPLMRFHEPTIKAIVKLYPEITNNHTVSSTSSPQPDFANFKDKAKPIPLDAPVTLKFQTS